MNGVEIFRALESVMPGRAFRKIAPMTVREPYVIFNRVLVQPQNNLCGYANSDMIRYQIDSYALTDFEAQSNMTLVIRALRANVDPPLVESLQDMYEQESRIHRTMAMITTWLEPVRVAR